MILRSHNFTKTRITLFDTRMLTYILNLGGRSFEKYIVHLHGTPCMYVFIYIYIYK